MQSNMISGNVAKPIETIPNGGVRVTVASSRYAGRNEDQSPKYETLFLQLVAFAKTAEYIIANVGKGDSVSAIYTIRNNNFEKDGVKVFGHNFYVDNFEVLKKAIQANPNQ